MSIEVRHDGDLTILRVDGDLAGSNAEELRLLAQQAMTEGQLDFRVDLTDATGCDSAGLEALTWLQRECQERLGLVQLTSTGPTIDKILELTRLRDIFQYGVPSAGTGSNDDV